MNTSESLVNYLDQFKLSLSQEYAIERHILTEGIWERHVVMLLNFFARAGSTCVDVGANTGVHSLLMARLVGEHGRVFSFEPNPEYLARIRKNLQLNPELAPRVTLIQKGVSGTSGKLKLFEAGDIKGNAYMSDAYDPKVWNRLGPDDFIECDVTTIDQELAHIPIDLMKIDVEGMESEVLRGALNAVRAHRPFLIYETLVKDFAPEKLIAMDTMVREEGYYTFYPSLNDGKLIRCNFPNVPEDVIALHPRRMLSAAPVLHNAARYNFSCQGSVELFGAPVFLTAVGVDTQKFGAVWSVPDDDSPEVAVVSENQECLEFSQEWESRSLVSRVNLLTRADGALKSLDVAQARVTTGSDEFIITGQKIGGHLY